MPPSATHARPRTTESSDGRHIRAAPESSSSSSSTTTSSATATTTALPSIRRRRRRCSASGALLPQRISRKVRLDVLGEHHRDAEVVSRDEAELVERTRVLLALRAVPRRAIAVAVAITITVAVAVVQEPLDGAEIAQGVTGVHRAELLLRELPAVARVGVDRAERVAR